MSVWVLGLILTDIFLFLVQREVEEIQSSIPSSVDHIRRDPVIHHYEETDLLTCLPNLLSHGLLSGLVIRGQGSDIDDRHQGLTLLAPASTALASTVSVGNRHAGAEIVVAFLNHTRKR